MIIQKPLKKGLIIVFFFLFFSVLFADDDIYSYTFNLDTTITGDVINEGRIFPNCKTTFVSIVPWYSPENQLPQILFLDENFSLIHQINFDDSNISIKKPLIFDFDGDLYDEIIFSISNSEKISYIFFDPSHKPIIQSKIFEIPIKNKNTKTRLSIAQLDDDDYPELIININERMTGKFTLNGLWAIDIENKSLLWENLSAEKLLDDNPINIIENNKSFLIYSTSSNDTKNILAFSNGYYFLNIPGNETFIYDKKFKSYKNIAIDTLSDDYSIDTIASIKAIDIHNNLIWEKIVGGKYTKTKIDTIRINGKKKIILTTSNDNVKLKAKSSVEIINPITGDVENKLFLSKRIKYSLIDKDKIFISCKDGTMDLLDMQLNSIASTRSKLSYYRPFAITNYNGNDLLFASKFPGIYQKIIAFDEQLKKTAQIDSRGIIHFLPDSKIIFVYDSRIRKSKLCSLHPLRWYEKITPNTIRNLTISFLLILSLVMILWINTLRVSWKKIKGQKDKLEAANKELKATSKKLIEAEKLAVYGTLASSIAHEINSPLGAIINSAQRIKKNKNADLDKNIDLIEKAGKRSKAIIEKLLLGSRNRNEEQRTNLVETLDDWMELSLKQFDNLGIEFKKEIECNLELAISSTELNQIFTNLFLNARDSIMEKNNTKKTIFIKTNKLDDKNCSIIIKDTGTGFSKSKLENPFEAFKTSKERGRGTGLGLWVVKNILDNIGGKIKIQNYEEGAKIELIIPIYFETSNAKK